MSKVFYPLQTTSVSQEINISVFFLQDIVLLTTDVTFA